MQVLRHVKLGFGYLSHSDDLYSKSYLLVLFCGPSDHNLPSHSHIRHLATESLLKAVGKSNAELKLHIIHISVSAHCWNYFSIQFSTCNVKKL